MRKYRITVSKSSILKSGYGEIVKSVKIGDNPQAVLEEYLKEIGLTNINISVSRKDYIYNALVQSDSRNNYYFVTAKLDISEVSIRQSIINAVANRDKNYLFHGSEGGINGDIDCEYNKPFKNKCDFGYGFYTGECLEQAENRVCNCSNAKVYVFEMIGEVENQYEFKDDTLWALYIGYNRGKIDISKYSKLKSIFEKIERNDLIIGLIADDKIANVYGSFLDGRITDRCLAECLKCVKYGRQFVFKNNNAISKHLKCVGKYTMDKVIRKNSLNWGMKAKECMSDSIKEIEIKYRRIGLYIDEVLEAYK